MAFAAVAPGAHGLLIEVHPNPDKALSDGPQSLNFDNFQRLMEGVWGIAGAVGRTGAPGLGYVSKKSLLSVPILSGVFGLDSIDQEFLP